MPNSSISTPLPHNLANVNTTGFKRSRAEFADLLYQISRLPGASASNVGQFPVGMQIGLGVRPVTVAKEYVQGSLKQTSNELDIALTGLVSFKCPVPMAQPCIPGLDHLNTTVPAMW